MRYTKEDLIKLEELVNEINDLLSQKFTCAQVKINTGQFARKLSIDIYERVNPRNLSEVKKLTSEI